MNTRSTLVLLAEDDAEDRYFFREAVGLVSKTAIVEEALNGEMVMNLLGTMLLAPDFIVLDINMPLMNGMECLKLIRLNDRFRGLPVVMMSTTNEYKTISAARKAGATFYAIKPASSTGMLAIVTYLLNFGWSGYQPNDDDFLLNNIVSS